MKEVTYEEMAEKYAKGLCKTCKVDVCRYSKIKTCTTKESLKQAYLAGLEYKNKENAELKEKISVLLSCKNCSENKGGLICAKEYENKCLAQKIEFIQELKKENAELKEKLNIRSCQNCRKYNRTCPNDGSCKNYSKWKGYKNPQLTKAKEIIKKFSEFVNNEVELDPTHPQEYTDLWIELCEKAERFIKE